MSQIERALKDETQDFWISNDDRIALIEILSLAKRFANMPVEVES